MDAPTCTRLATGDAARAYFAARLPDRAREALCVAHLDAQGRVLGHTLADGGPDRVPLPLRRVFADALRLGADGMLLAHTHPGGAAEPSVGDLTATRLAAEVAEALGIRLHDHLILLPDGRAVSFRALGLL